MPVVQLDAPFVRNAICPEGKSKVDHYDQSMRGFVLEVRRSGGKTYYLRYRNNNGRLKQHKIADAKDISLEKARQAAQKLRARVVLGEDPTEQRKAVRSIPILRTFAEERFLPYLTGYRRRLDTDEGILRLHLLPKWGTRHLDEITHEEVVAFHKAKRATGLSAGYCNHMVIVLSHLYRLAAKWKIPGAEVNPAQGVQLFETIARDRFLTREETQRLMQAVERNENPMLKYIIPLLLLTGARKSELLKSTWSDFDLDRRIWNIPMSKSGKRRHVPLSDTAIQLLALVPRFPDCPFVVPNPSTRRPFQNFHDAWDRARQDAGLPNLRLHDLRHSAASYMANAGRTLYEIQMVLGHAQSKTTQRYAHLSNQTLLDVVNTAASASGIEIAE
jgi:integrase